MGASGGRRLAGQLFGGKEFKCLKLKRRKLKSAEVATIDHRARIGAAVDGREIVAQTIAEEARRGAEIEVAIAAVNSVSVVAHAALASGVARGRRRSISTS
jgi:hypothetical protein